MKGHIEPKNLHREEARKANPQTPLSSVTLVHLIQLEARAWLGLEAEWLRAGTWVHLRDEETQGQRSEVHLYSSIVRMSGGWG